MYQRERVYYFSYKCHTCGILASNIKLLILISKSINFEIFPLFIVQVILILFTDEYRHLTGTAFPLHDNITDFLLTIPHVTAECCKSGKRIFNIKPTEDTRHLHDMILHQRQRENGNNNNNDKINNNSIMYAQEPPRLWRSQYKRRYPLKLNNNLNINEKPPSEKTLPVQSLATTAVEPFGVYQDNWEHL